MDIINFISQAWPWYVSGPLIALVMFMLLWVGGGFGVSSTLRSACAIAGAGSHSEFFRFDWKAERWNLVFALGAIIGGFISSTVLANPEALQLSNNTVTDLGQLDISFDGDYAPTAIFNWGSLLTIKGFLIMVVGGFLVGFGARWAGGCTSGHAITGLSNLQVPSLIAVIGFFIGGLFMTFVLFPLIF